MTRPGEGRRWEWEPTNVNTVSLSGDVSKLFRNEPINQPGVFERDAPPSQATVMAREVIQNSWDAALELKKWAREGATGHSPLLPEFDIVFKFRSVQGEQKASLSAALALSDLASRVVGYLEYPVEGDQPARSGADLGLVNTSCLDDLKDLSKPLRYLEICETGTTGMYGPWGEDSRMYLALATLGYTPKLEGGGSYGYGKAGLIKGSAIHSVIAYSCFKARSDDPDVTRRLLGMTYWAQHRVVGGSTPGFAHLGDKTEGGVRPYINEAADEVAQSLGLPLRDPDERHGPGTTFLLIDPTVSPDDLVQAIERNWWPALEDPSIEFNVTVVEEDGKVRHPRPRLNPALGAFVDAYHLATVPQDNSNPHQSVTSLPRVGQVASAGKLGLVANLNGWSYPDQNATDSNAGVDHRSLVALMRRPRMVVTYYHVKRRDKPPYVRGVFVAHDDLDDALRRSEPKGHDSWQEVASYDVPNDATLAAKRVHANIRRQINLFKKRLTPPHPPQEQIRMPVFDNLMRRLMRGGGRGPVGPPPAPRDITIRLTPLPEPADNGEVRTTGHAEFALSDSYGGSQSDVRIRLRYLFVEDGRSAARAELSVIPPNGFEPMADDESMFVGELHRGQSAIFEFKSEPHPEFWTGRFYAEAELMTVQES